MTQLKTQTKASRIIRALGFMTIMLGLSGLAQADINRVDRKIPGRYIVRLKADVASPSSAAKSADMLPTVAEIAGRLSRRYRGKEGLKFQRVFQGFAVEMSEEDAESLADDPLVESVEEDGVVFLAGVQVNPASWAIDRIDQRNNPLDQKFVYADDGSGVQIYIIDTGVRSTHVELAGRVDTANALSLIHDGLGTEDTNGHGTAVATVAAGATLGVAKNAIIHPIRVFGNSGSGSISNVVYGIDWVINNRGRHHGQYDPSIINLSIQSGPAPTLDDAVRSAVAAGIFVTVAAGNVNDDACGVSPARVAEALTVGATDSNDARASFSDYGPCVDLFAPGQDVLTAGGWDDAATIFYSGTSFSAPYAAGVAAMYLQMNPTAGPDELRWAVLNSVSPVVPDEGLGSPAGLLYSAFIQEGMNLPPEAAFSFSCRGLRCTFDASTSVDDGSIKVYSWDFGDGAAATKKGPRVGHRFGAAQTSYFVTLTVEDDSGELSSVSHMVTLN